MPTILCLLSIDSQEGSYDRIVKSIGILIRNNAPLQISMTVTRKNIHNVEAMVHKFGSLLTFAPLFKAGRAKAHKKLAITGKEYYKVFSSCLLSCKHSYPLLP